MKQEIERRFLIKGLVWEHLRFQKPMRVIQGYLDTASANVSLRIRITDGIKGVVTQKMGRGLIREEFEQEVGLELAKVLMESCRHKVEKTRYIIRGWIVDYYLYNLGGIITAEKEFNSLEEAAKLVLPDWLIDPVEVTDILTSHKLAKLSTALADTGFSVSMFKKLLV